MQILCLLIRKIAAGTFLAFIKNAAGCGRYRKSAAGTFLGFIKNAAGKEKRGRNIFSLYKKCGRMRQDAAGTEKVRQEHFLVAVDSRIRFCGRMRQVVAVGSLIRFCGRMRQDAAGCGRV